MNQPSGNGKQLAMKLYGQEIEDTLKAQEFARAYDKENADESFKIYFDMIYAMGNNLNPRQEWNVVQAMADYAFNSKEPDFKQGTIERFAFDVMRYRHDQKTMEE